MNGSIFDGIDQNVIAAIQKLLSNSDFPNTSPAKDINIATGCLSLLNNAHDLAHNMGINVNYENIKFLCTINEIYISDSIFQCSKEDPSIITEIKPFIRHDANAIIEVGDENYLSHALLLAINESWPPPTYSSDASCLD